MQPRGAAHLQLREPFGPFRACGSCNTQHGVAQKILAAICPAPRADGGVKVGDRNRPPTDRTRPVNPSNKGVLLALAAFGIFASHDAIIKYLGGSYSPFQIVFFSVLFGFPVVTFLFDA